MDTQLLMYKIVQSWLSRPYNEVKDEIEKMKFICEMMKNPADRLELNRRVSYGRNRMRGL